MDGRSTPAGGAAEETVPKKSSPPMKAAAGGGADTGFSTGPKPSSSTCAQMRGRKRHATRGLWHLCSTLPTLHERGAQQQEEKQNNRRGDVSLRESFLSDKRYREAIHLPVLCRRELIDLIVLEALALRHVVHLPGGDQTAGQPVETKGARYPPPSTGCLRAAARQTETAPKDRGRRHSSRQR